MTYVASLHIAIVALTLTLKKPVQGAVSIVCSGLTSKIDIEVELRIVKNVSLKYREWTHKFHQQIPSLSNTGSVNEYRLLELSVTRTSIIAINLCSLILYLISNINNSGEML